MDMLSLVIIYMLLFAVGCLCILYRDSNLLTTGLIGALRNTLTETLSSFIPRMLQDWFVSAANYLLYQRNCFFQVLFVVLAILAHAVFFIDMLPILLHFYPDQNHTFWPFVAVFVNYACLHMAWISDPGEITAANHAFYSKIYEFDNAMYKSDEKCKTCKFVKPSRSKHCSICNRCVHRFDHHCIWTNNCVGAYTHRYFILFMVTMLVGFCQAIYVGIHCCLLYAQLWKLNIASYVAEDGTAKPVTFAVGLQHLFIQVPRLVFLVLAIIVLFVLVFIFLCQHLHYIFINQTTNERYKLAYFLKQQKVATHHHNRKSSSPLINISPTYRPYSRGILNNICEVFFPSSFIKSRVKSK